MSRAVAGRPAALCHAGAGSFDAGCALNSCVCCDAALLLSSVWSNTIFKTRSPRRKSFSLNFGLLAASNSHDGKRLIMLKTIPGGVEGARGKEKKST